MALLGDIITLGIALLVLLKSLAVSNSLPKQEITGPHLESGNSSFGGFQESEKTNSGEEENERNTGREIEKERKRGDE